MPPLGNLFDSVYPQTEVCHRSQLDAAMGSDSDRVDEVRSTAAIVGKALTGDIMARTRIEYGQAEGSLRCRVTYARRPAAVTSTSPPVMRAVRRLFIYRLLRIFGGRGCNYLSASAGQSIGYSLFTRVRRRG